MLNVRLVLAVAVCLFSVNWTVRDLGTLRGGGASVALAISNSGYIVGYAYDAAGRKRAVIFKDPVVEIPTPAGVVGSTANDVSDTGLIAGQMEGEGFFMPIGGSLVSFGPRTGAYAVNDHGDVAGYGVFGPTGSLQHAYVWPGATAPPLYLGHLGSGPSSTTRDLSEYPLACGWSEYDKGLPGFQRAFLWYEGAMLDLGALPGGDRSGADRLMVESWPDHSFTSTWVVGHSETASLDWHAFVWNAGVMTDLGTLHGHDESRALDLNKRRVIVGYSRLRGSSDQRAVMWVDGAMYDLNDLLPPGSGWELRTATGINDRGQIVGMGVIGTKLRAYALDPW